MPITLYPANDNVVETTALRFSSTGAAVTAATITTTLKDTNGTAVTGADTLSMAHAGDGVYRTYITDSVSLTVGATYTLTTTGSVTDPADSGNTLNFQWVQPVSVVTRT